MQYYQPLTLALLGVSIALFISLIIRKDERAGAWLRTALTSIGDGVIITDRKGRIRAFSQIAEKLTGWTFREAVGKPWSDVLRLVDHDTRAPIETPVTQALKAGKIPDFLHNVMLISRHGHESPVDIGISPIRGRGKRIHGVALLFREITARYASEQKLLESEERLKAVTDTARIGLVMIDRERRYVYANSFYFKMIGMTGLNVVGKRIVDVLPLIYRQIQPNLDRAFAGERLSYEIKGVQKKELGLNRIYSVTYEPQARHSLITHVILVILDITDIKKEAMENPQPPETAKT